MNVFKLTARSEKSTMKKSYLEMSEVCTFFRFSSSASTSRLVVVLLLYRIVVMSKEIIRRRFYQPKPLHKTMKVQFKYEARKHIHRPSTMQITLNESLNILIQFTLGSTSIRNAWKVKCKLLSASQIMVRINMCYKFSFLYSQVKDAVSSG